MEKSITSKTGSKYDVKMYRYMDFENDPGDFHVIDIYYGGKRIFSQKFDLGWDYFYTRETYERSVSKPFELIELTNNRLAIVFTGITITSEPPMITVILLENGTASLVYNKPSFLNKVTRNADSVVFDMQLDNGEIPYEGAQPGDPKARRLTFKNGLIYFQAF